MLAALTNLGFSEDEQKQLLNATAAVLHLGELKLAKDEKVAHGDDAAKIADFGPLDTAAALLQARDAPPLCAPGTCARFSGRRPSRRPLRDPRPLDLDDAPLPPTAPTPHQLFPRHHPHKLGVLSLPNPAHPQVEHYAFAGAMTSVKVREQTAALSVVKATKNRDAFIKALYEKLFDWIVHRINQVGLPP